MQPKQDVWEQGTNWASASHAQQMQHSLSLKSTSPSNFTLSICLDSVCLISRADSCSSCLSFGAYASPLKDPAWQILITVSRKVVKKRVHIEYIDQWTHPNNTSTSTVPQAHNRRPPKMKGKRFPCPQNRYCTFLGKYLMTGTLMERP